MIDPVTIDAVSKVGFPIVAALLVAGFMAVIGRWFMRTGDRLTTKFETHVDKLDERLDQIKPQLDRIEAKDTCRAPAPHAHRPATI